MHPQSRKLCGATKDDGVQVRITAKNNSISAKCRGNDIFWLQKPMENIT